MVLSLRQHLRHKNFFSTTMHNYHQKKYIHQLLGRLFHRRISAVNPSPSPPKKAGHPKFENVKLGYTDLYAGGQTDSHVDAKCAKPYFKAALVANETKQQ